MPGIAEPDVLEIWGGIECSVVRIGDTWRNQVRETGHYLRAEADIDRIAALGIRKLRYPLLWEEVERGTAYGCNWAWHDVTMKALQKRGIEVIAGLLHHGSGPSYNSLLDLNFPRAPGSACRRSRRSVSIRSQLDTGQRGADDRAFQLSLWSLVSTPAR